MCLQHAKVPPNTAQRARPYLQLAGHPQSWTHTPHWLRHLFFAVLQDGSAAHANTRHTSVSPGSSHSRLVPCCYGQKVAHEPAKPGAPPPQRQCLLQLLQQQRMPPWMLAVLARVLLCRPCCLASAASAAAARRVRGACGGRLQTTCVQPGSSQHTCCSAAGVGCCTMGPARPVPLTSLAPEHQRVQFNQGMLQRPRLRHELLHLTACLPAGAGFEFAAFKTA